MVKSRFLYITVILILSNFTICGQTNIKEFTLNIVDTTSSKSTQAYDIYSWITHNIKYDLQSFKKGEFPNYTPTELLKKRKGLCGDYAVLFDAMANSVGIEVYTIAGYNKGYRYNKQKPFLRANHSWNIVFTDSSWKHIDCTWGSGYVLYKPSFIQNVSNKLLGTAVVNSKSKFKPEADYDYFDITVDALLKTHYPLDAKWLFTTTPMSIKQFQNDTLELNESNPFFKDEISKIRGKSFIYTAQIEAENGKVFNPLNYFDLANVYLNKSLNYDTEREITEQNLSQFQNYLTEQSIAVDEITQYKLLIDSIYRVRSTMLKDVSRTQKRISGRIKSKAKKAQKTHGSSQKKIVGKSSSYSKKMSGFQLNIGRTEIKKIPDIASNELLYSDTSLFKELRKDISDLRSELPELYNKVDSLFGVVDNFAVIDAEIDDSIAHSNYLFNTNIDTLFFMILSSDEQLIISYVDSLKMIYKDIEDFLGDKKTAKNDLQNTGREFYSVSSAIQKKLRQEMSLNTKLQKIANNADTLQQAYNNVIYELILCYKKSMIFTRKLSNHNDLQADIREENLHALKHHKKKINKENKYFIAWYENHMEKEKLQYTREKEIAKQIKSTTSKNKKVVETKLNKYIQDTTGE